MKRTGGRGVREVKVRRLYYKSERTEWRKGQDTTTNFTLQ